jgi:hypothetical protein
MSTINRRAILAGAAAAAIPIPVLACEQPKGGRDRDLALVAEPEWQTVRARGAHET